MKVIWVVKRKRPLAGMAVVFVGDERIASSYAGITRIRFRGR